MHLLVRPLTSFRLLHTLKSSIDSDRGLLHVVVDSIQHRALLYDQLGHGVELSDGGADGEHLLLPLLHYRIVVHESVDLFHGHLLPSCVCLGESRPGRGTSREKEGVHVVRASLDRLQVLRLAGSEVVCEIGEGEEKGGDGVLAKSLLGRLLAPSLTTQHTEGAILRLLVSEPD